MKIIITHLLFLLTCLQLSAQTGSNTDSLLQATMATARSYVKSGGLDAAKAFGLFSQCAAQGNAEAMNALGVQYTAGLGVAPDHQKAMEWFTKAANAGYPGAWYNLGMGYKDSLDFTRAYESFDKGAGLKDPRSIYAKGYMLYKGLGCTQDYTQAARLFAGGAITGSPNSMYFYGLCLRNGYGVAVNTDSARYWLIKASARGYKMATDELNAKTPENVSLAGSLVRQIKAAQEILPPGQTVNQYQKIDNNLIVSNMAGQYSGYLLKYDWSGQHVVSADKLAVTLTTDKDSLKGIWTENDSLTLNLQALVTPGALVFNQMVYRKSSHYNAANPELLVFEKASLQLVQDNHTVYLAGNLQQFSPERKEPARPMYVALIRTAAFDSKDTVSTDKLRLLRAYPNPFNGIITLDFELKEPCRVVTQLLTIDGKVVYSNTAGLLAAGSYTLPIQAPQLAAGYYLLKLQYGNKEKIVKMLKQ